MARRRRGYVLLMTLMLIPIAGVALASIERLSMSRALEASRAERELQRRWLATSCRATVIKQAQSILEKAELDRGALDQSVMMVVGGCQMELIFTDEQSKPNVNTLWSTRDPEQCEEAVNNLLKGCSIATTLRPTPPEILGFDGGNNFGTFGQVFGSADPAKLVGSQDRADAAAGRVTLWGSGKLNFQRANSASLEAICSPVLGLGDVEKILAIRADLPSIGTVKLLNSLEVTKDQRTELLKRITDHSDCFGLWIILRDSDGVWYSFAAGPVDGTIKNVSW